jgi:hypothetical protein
VLRNEDKRSSSLQELVPLEALRAPPHIERAYGSMVTSQLQPTLSETILSQFSKLGKLIIAGSKNDSA